MRYALVVPFRLKVRLLNVDEPVIIHVVAATALSWKVTDEEAAKRVPEEFRKLPKMRIVDVPTLAVPFKSVKWLYSRIYG
jgi:hypothetical protein